MLRDRLSDFVYRLRVLFRRRAVETELDEELRFHFEQQVAKNVAAGMSRAEARRQARLVFGGLDQVKEECREARGVGFVETVMEDLRYAVRQLVKSPGFTAVAVLSLALGIGANTAIFSLVDALMLRPLPVERPEELVEFLNQYPGDPALNVFSWSSYEHFRDQSRSFSDMTGVGSTVVQIRGEGFASETLQADVVAGNYFRLLALKPSIGRLLEPTDDQMGATRSHVAVVSWAYWNRLNLDPAIIGRQIVVAEMPLTIVGVAPRNFSGLHRGIRKDIWITSATETEARRPGTSDRQSTAVVARLRPGVSIEEVREEMEILFQRTVEERVNEASSAARRSLERQLVFSVEPAGHGLATPLRRHFAQPLLAVMAIVGLLLLIACTNLGGLLLARGAAREREMALRVSLGAGRARLMHQVLTESLLLSSIGALIGLFLAYFGAEAIVGIIASGRPLIGMSRIEIQPEPDFYVLLFTCGVALLSGLFFGFPHALHAIRTAPASPLRARGRSGETRRGRWFGRSLVAAQVALSLLLLSAAGLFVRHLSNLRHVGVGFDRENLLLVKLDAGAGSDQPEQPASLYRELLERLEAIPGVDSVTLSGMTPMSGAAASRFVDVEGFEESPGERRYVSLNGVAPRYFETFGTPLLAGRDFRFEEQNRARVAIINESFSRYYFDGRDAIGKYVRLDGDEMAYEIVGVVGDAKYNDLRRSPPRTMYRPVFRQGTVAGHNVTLRTLVDPAMVAGDVHRVVGQVLRGVTIGKVTTMAEQMDASIVPERIMALLSGMFGGLGMLLAAIGLYGLLAFTVARRVGEIGVRMALGATSRDATWMVLRDALAMVAVGLGIGLPICLWASQFMSSLLAGIEPMDPSMLLLTVGILTAVAFLAALIPAWRASRVDPLRTLRHE